MLRDTKPKGLFAISFLKCRHFKLGDFFSRKKSLLFYLDLAKMPDWNLYKVLKVVLLLKIIMSEHGKLHMKLIPKILKWLIYIFRNSFNFSLINELQLLTVNCLFQPRRSRLERPALGTERKGPLTVAYHFKVNALDGNNINQWMDLLHGKRLRNWCHLVNDKIL